MSTSSEPRRKAPVLFLDEVDSTNSRLKALARDGAADGSVLIAARQSAGRGRRGRSFVSDAGGLYLSYLLLTSQPPERALSLTPGAAVAVCRAIERVCHLRCRVKWPNDLLYGGKKLCGILTESIALDEGRGLVLGIGVNLNTRHFPPELAGSAASVWQLTGRETALDVFAGALIEELDAMALRWRRDERAGLEAYRSLCDTVGREILVWQDGQARPARALAVNDDFSLAVAYPDGTGENLRFGEVTIRE